MKMISSVPDAEGRVVKGNAEVLSIAQTSLSAGQGQSSQSARRKANATDTSSFRSYPRLKQSETYTLAAAFELGIWRSLVALLCI